MAYTDVQYWPGNARKTLEWPAISVPGHCVDIGARYMRRHAKAQYVGRRSGDWGETAKPLFRRLGGVWQLL